jgi:hypothetical protein
LLEWPAAVHLRSTGGGWAPVSPNFSELIQRLPRINNYITHKFTDGNEKLVNTYLGRYTDHFVTEDAEIDFSPTENIDQHDVSCS